MTSSKSASDYCNWSQRYLNHQLTEEEKRDYEYYLLENSDAASDLQIDTVFQEILPSVMSKKASLVGRALAFFSLLYSTPMRASACTFCACLLVFSLAYPSGKVTGLASSQIEYLESVRSSSSEVPIFKMRSGSDMIALMVQTYFAEPDAKYDVKVIAENSQRVVFEQDVKGNEFGELLIVLTRGHVHSGAHSVLVTPVVEQVDVKAHAVEFVLELE